MEVSMQFLEIIDVHGGWWRHWNCCGGISLSGYEVRIQRTDRSLLLLLLLLAGVAEVVWLELEQRSSNAGCRSVLFATGPLQAMLESPRLEFVEVALLVVGEHVLAALEAEQTFHLLFQSWTRESLHFATLSQLAKAQISGMETAAVV